MKFEIVRDEKTVVYTVFFFFNKLRSEEGIGFFLRARYKRF